MLVFPVATSTSKFVPTSNVVPSNVKLASSSSAPDVPATIIRLSVKSLTVAVLITTSPVPAGVILIAPLVFVLVTVLPLILILSTSKSPVMSTAAVAEKVVPSNVKFASSSREPLVPAITILLLVKSLTVAVLITTSPEPFGVILIAPLVFVLVTVLPLILILSTSKSPVMSTAAVAAKVVPSNVRLASSSSSPPVPAITILLLVKSSTLALAKSAWVPISILDTERVSVVGLYVKSASSCTSPLVPTVTILPAVRSVTFTVPNVAESAARLSAFTVPSK